MIFRENSNIDSYSHYSYMLEEEFKGAADDDSKNNIKF